jgi:enamine deaminase RidA (YjgF/YER057c/UK114 family)
MRVARLDTITIFDHTNNPVKQIRAFAAEGSIDLERRTRIDQKGVLMLGGAPKKDNDMSDIRERLEQLGIMLPTPTAPKANYVPYRWSGNLLYISGQVPAADGRDHYVGKLGEGVSLEDGQKAARLCAVNILAHLNVALAGDLDRVRACIKLGGFVNSAPGFDAHPSVVNGASDLMVEVFGERGRHTRFAIGCAALPRNVSVEVDAIFECDPPAR